VIKSPRECKSIVVQPEDLKYRVLMIHKDKKDLRGTNVLKYIREGERKGYHLRPTCASKKRWYDLGHQNSPDGLWFKAFNDRVIAPQNNYQFFSSDRFYAIYTHSRSAKDTLFMYLNSTLPFLLVELYGRVNLGEGALDNMTYEAATMPVLDTAKYNFKKGKTSEEFLNRKILSIFGEIDASSPEDVSLDKVKSDRRELDKIVMGDILGLTDSEQLEVYRAVVDLVKSRLERAKSLGERRKTKEGIDVDLLVKTVMDRLGEDTLGKFYQEKILILKTLRTERLPVASGKVRLEQELFGWRLSYGRKLIACASEPEARYLKVWLEAGLESVKIPKDEAYLASIIPELEELKQKIDGVFENYLVSILDSRTRQHLLHQLWQEITKSTASSMTSTVSLDKERKIVEEAQ
ncbi:MAG: hypothetical protein J7L90_02305, partial [Dehalococcoidia bacterium]|nr:hypothetical protein [Dehalococcoidia bacterium]